MTRTERHELGLEFCRDPKCASCAYYRKRLSEAQRAAEKQAKGRRA